MNDLNFIKDLQTLNYQEYIKEHPLNEILNEEIDNPEDLGKKLVRPLYESVDPDNHTPFSTEYDDLIRLHRLIISRKVTTILEFGVGKSTAIFNHALKYNEELHLDYMKKNLRRSNLFECHSVDNNQEWIDITKNNYPNLEKVNFHNSPIETSTFNDRVCTFYNVLPNICPDFIYLDAPDQFSSTGDVRGISTRHPDRLPMSADILAFENFLLPGTMVVVDGRTANATFLKNNFQRNWKYYHAEDFDQHFFELQEKPLGPYNKKQIEYCLGNEWMNNL